MKTSPPMQVVYISDGSDDDDELHLSPSTASTGIKQPDNARIVAKASVNINLNFTGPTAFVPSPSTLNKERKGCFPAQPAAVASPSTPRKQRKGGTPAQGPTTPNRQRMDHSVHQERPSPNPVYGSLLPYPVAYVLTWNLILQLRGTVRFMVQLLITAQFIAILKTPILVLILRISPVQALVRGMMTHPATIASALQGTLGNPVDCISSLLVARLVSSADGMYSLSSPRVTPFPYGLIREEVAYSVDGLQDAVWTRIISNDVEEALQRMDKMMLKGAVRVVGI
jgi:hypothetical protein